MYRTKKCFNCHLVVGCYKINPNACDRFEPHYYTHFEIAKMCRIAERTLARIIKAFGMRVAIKTIRKMAKNNDITWERTDDGKILFCRRRRV